MLSSSFKFMSYRSSLVTLACAFLPSFAYAVDDQIRQNGSFTCIVKGQHLELINQNGPAAFEGMTGGLEIGDKTNFGHLLSGDEEYGYRLRIRFHKGEDTLIELNSMISDIDLDISPEYGSFRATERSEYSPKTKADFGQNFITLTRGENFLLMDNYDDYKWLAMHVKADFPIKDTLATLVTTFDCEVDNYSDGILPLVNTLSNLVE